MTISPTLLHQDYAARLRAGAMQPDAVQAAALEKLAALAAALQGYVAAPPPKGWLARLCPAPRPPKGLYLWGPVGRGKSMLMDLFFTHAPVGKKQRVHFHAFMLEVHSRIHHWRKAHKGDPIPAAAAEIAASAHLLCFDEFQVTDVADAMILARLFTALFTAGVVVVATSNTPPERLYEGGLQRALFLPFIDVLKQQVETITVAGPIDYRRRRLKGKKTYYTPLDSAAETALAAAFADLTDGITAGPLTLEIAGHQLTIPKAAHGVAWFHFDELCKQAKGAIDYQAIAANFPTLFVEGIPVIDPEARDIARRFITLIDTLYDQRIKLVASAAVDPEWVYAAGQHVGEFERTVSRLYEMQTEAYWAENQG